MSCEDKLVLDNIGEGSLLNSCSLRIRALGAPDLAAILASSFESSGQMDMLVSQHCVLVMHPYFVVRT